MARPPPPTTGPDTHRPLLLLLQAILEFAVLMERPQTSREALLATQELSARAVLPPPCRHRVTTATPDGVRTCCDCGARVEPPE